MSTTKYMKEYKEVEEFIIAKLKDLPRGGLARLSREFDLPENELSRFKNRKLRTTRPFFIKNILKALGYSNIQVTTTVYYKYEKDFEKEAEHES